MEFDLTKKKACSSIGLAFVIFLLLIFINLMSSISWLQNQYHFKPQDHDLPKTVPDPDPQLKDPNPPSPLSTRITCDRSHFRYDLCSINGPTVLDPTNATLYSIGPTSNFEKIKPYPRKLENDILAKIRVINLKSGPIGPKCGIHHNSPAIVFSTGGLTGNFFHDFTDGLLPLYITLNYLSLGNRDVILVVDNARDWWTRKYADVIRGFTKHPIINLENEKATHCFTRAHVGLISHGNMALDATALPRPLTLAHFRSFLRNVFYRHEVGAGPSPRRPRLVLVAREGSVGRVITNQEKARLVAVEVGFDVVIYSPTKRYPLCDAYNLISKSHALIGVHGAGMTHMLFLRQGSVSVQVLPLGLEWVGRLLFGQPARDLGLEYIEYKIGYNESSLSMKYEKGSHILKDAKELLVEKGWVLEFMNVYMKEQDIKLDLVRFKTYMKKVYKKAKRFMDMYG
ncbi:hypothetical protein V2J09_015358 [Rumex salicifolius]